MIINNWSKVFPIHAIENNFIIGGSGELTIGYKLLLTEIYTITIDEANKLNDDFVKFLLSGVNADVQQIKAPNEK